MPAVYIILYRTSNEDTPSFSFVILKPSRRKIVLKLMSVISMECTCLHIIINIVLHHYLRQCLPLFVLREKDIESSSVVRPLFCVYFVVGESVFHCFFYTELREGSGGERMRFIKELLSSPHIIIAD